MLTRYIVAYDITDDKRLRKVFKKMRGFGDHIQYSVFICDLSPKEKVMMITALSELIHHKDDQVIIVSLGPPEGRGGDCIEALGKSFSCPERHAIVI